MRIIPILLASSVAIASAAVAAPPAGPSASETLRTALHSMVANAQKQQSIDRDQGDDHASLRAIEEVCSHDNPSGRRSAICPVPVSPS